MTKSRVEAFSDGVIAIIITIMVLELKTPHETKIEALAPFAKVLGCYAMSFIYVGIYWNNHHHLFQAVKQVKGTVLWANLHLLFWLSLFPWATRWVGEADFASLPVAAYGVILLMAAVAYTILVRALLKHHEHDSALAKSIGSDFKGKVSLAAYVVAVLLASVSPALACAVFVIVAMIWLVPDKRIERNLD